MIIITGASRGIGRFLLETYVEKGEKVVGTYNTSLVEGLEPYYEKLNVTNPEEINAFVEKYQDSLEEITLINCAGITHNGFAHKIDYEKWKNVLEVNLIGTYNFIRAILPFMRKQKFGRIINFSSVVAVKPTPGVSAYAASKSALWGLSRSIGIENAALNVTINNVNLGYSELGMIQTVPDEYITKIMAEIPAGILCSSGDILNTIEYLRTTQYITGTSIELSGGLI